MILRLRHEISRRTLRYLTSSLIALVVAGGCFGDRPPPGADADGTGNTGRDAGSGGAAGAPENGGGGSRSDGGARSIGNGDGGDGGTGDGGAAGDASTSIGGTGGTTGTGGGTSTGTGGSATVGNGGTGGAAIGGTSGTGGTGGGTSGAVCGNDVLESGEECDDGNTKDGDGCSSYCTQGCETCLANECGTPIEGVEPPTTWPNACSLVPGVADDGPAQGTSRAELCERVVACVRRQRCWSGDEGQAPFLDCYCGSSSRSECLGGEANGPCKEEVEWAAESIDPATVAGRGNNTAFAIGAAHLILVNCDVPLCPDECLLP